MTSRPDGCPQQPFNGAAGQFSECEGQCQRGVDAESETARSRPRYRHQHPGNAQSEWRHLACQPVSRREQPFEFDPMHQIAGRPFMCKRRPNEQAIREPLGAAPGRATRTPRTHRRAAPVTTSQADHASEHIPQEGQKRREPSANSRQPTASPKSGSAARGRPMTSSQRLKAEG